jgi:plasmid stabilization system protein ParE
VVYLEEHAVSATGGADLADSIIAACDLLGDSPLIGTPRPELRQGLRSFAVNPYTLFYRVIRGKVEIVRVLHQRQDIAREFGTKR